MQKLVVEPARDDGEGVNETVKEIFFVEIRSVGLIFLVLVENSNPQRHSRAARNFPASRMSTLIFSRHIH